MEDAGLGTEEIQSLVQSPPKARAAAQKSNAKLLQQQKKKKVDPIVQANQKEIVAEILKRNPNLFKDKSEVKLKVMVKDKEGKSKMETIVLKSQGAYVPFEKKYPVQRRRQQRGEDEAMDHYVMDENLMCPVTGQQLEADGIRMQRDHALPSTVGLILDLTDFTVRHFWI